MICQLWNTEYPQNLAITATAFDAFLESSASQTHFLILENERDLVGWAYTFDREGDRWFSIIISHQHQGKGLGHVLLNLIKEKENRLNGWVIDHPNDRKQNTKLQQTKNLPVFSLIGPSVLSAMNAAPCTRQKPIPASPPRIS